ncbi:hypothetical protein Ae201684P_020790 [Aphanomyces euteiches]|nr:hypothetical protein Ae201684P_020790 [Aphanomyces euteiches]
MPFNRPPPEQRSRRPDRFYSVDQANAYHSEANADIQRDLTRMALSLLPHSNNPLLLDLGCGSGLSTQHLPPLSIGVDVSASMLKLAAKDVDHGYICAAAFALPFRNDSFDHCISISMLQWLSLQQLHQFFRELARILKPTGTAVLQVYPLDLPHADEMVQAARKETGKPVVLVADFPHSNSALKWFLCVDSTADEKSHDKCPLARRMDRACAYNYRKQRGLQQGRLGLEHVLYAWHAVITKSVRSFQTRSVSSTDSSKFWGRPYLANN